jgi:hypothetical protein
MEDIKGPVRFRTVKGAEYVIISESEWRLLNQGDVEAAARLAHELMAAFVAQRNAANEANPALQIDGEQAHELARMVEFIILANAFNGPTPMLNYSRAKCNDNDYKMAFSAAQQLDAVNGNLRRAMTECRAAREEAELDMEAQDNRKKYVEGQEVEEDQLQFYSVYDIPSLETEFDAVLTLDRMLDAARRTLARARGMLNVLQKRLAERNQRELSEEIERGAGITLGEVISDQVNRIRRQIALLEGLMKEAEKLYEDLPMAEIALTSAAVFDAEFGATQPLRLDESAYDAAVRRLEENMARDLERRAQGGEVPSEDYGHAGPAVSTGISTTLHATAQAPQLPQAKGFFARLFGIVKRSFISLTASLLTVGALSSIIGCGSSVVAPKSAEKPQEPTANRVETIAGQNIPEIQYSEELPSSLFANKFVQNGRDKEAFDEALRRSIKASKTPEYRALAAKAYKFLSGIEGDDGIGKDWWNSKGGPRFAVLFMEGLPNGEHFAMALSDLGIIVVSKDVFTAKGDKKISDKEIKMLADKLGHEGTHINNFREGTKTGKYLSRLKDESRAYGATYRVSRKTSDTSTEQGRLQVEAQRQVYLAFEVLTHPDKRADVCKALNIEQKDFDQAYYKDIKIIDNGIVEITLTYDGNEVPIRIDLSKTLKTGNAKDGIILMFVKEGALKPENIQEQLQDLLPQITPETIFLSAPAATGAIPPTPTPPSKLQQEALIRGELDNLGGKASEARKTARACEQSL